MRIAVITMGVKLGYETRGYTRFLTIAEQLANVGFDVELITSTFQHWDKAQRKLTNFPFFLYKFKPIFIYEPGYNKNIDLSRIRSHGVAAKNLAKHLRRSEPYDLIYCEMPPNDVAKAAAKYCVERDIPFVVDVNDLWPEAMRMRFDVPVLSEIVFAPFKHDANYVYQHAAATVGTSNEYARNPKLNKTISRTVYVGNDISVFDAGVERYRREVNKPEGDFWVIYTGTLGESYDLSTAIEAIKLLKERGNTKVKLVIVGDGPEKSDLERLAITIGESSQNSYGMFAKTSSSKLIKNDCSSVFFTGYLEYPYMAAYLAASDITLNSLVRKAPQSIVNKVADYLAAGKPMINTGSNAEFCELVSKKGFGVNIKAEDSASLAAAIEELQDNDSARTAMSIAARQFAESDFDRATAYKRIIDLICWFLS